MAGQEQKIANEIKLMAERDLIKNISDALVPCKQVLKIKKGKKVQESQKLFPGYVFINTDLNSNVYSIVSSIPKVMGFLGRKNNPEEVPESKMNDIISLISGGNNDNNSTQIFEVGEVLNITEGPFESFSGAVEGFDHEKQRVKISVLIFGRATSVELDISQVEKIS